VAIDHLMEDAATAEIARAQLWQWIAHAARLDDGRAVTRELFKTILADELRTLGPGYDPAAALLARLVLSPKFEMFLTLAAYEAVSEREVVSP
jgi:malate synthase